MATGRLWMDAIIYTLVNSAMLLIPFAIQPRLFLKDMPETIRAAAQPMTREEKRQAWFIFVIFILFVVFYPIVSVVRSSANGFLSIILHLFILTMSFNLTDWLILDWLLFCTINPTFMSLPGTRGDPAYQDYGVHFRGFLIGTALCAVYSASIAVILFWIQ
ncbi:MAG: hypothetical protein JW750_00610 [Anaerolineaceae bacterium]|nr:hypothetical protein [Anaerolineaceae bacterium]